MKKAIIIIPVYNEAENLKILIPKILTTVRYSQIYIVDDNSTDNTRKVLRQIKSSRVTYLFRDKKMGRGTAVIHGFKHAYNTTSSDVFVEMDADLSHDPKELPNLLKLVDHNTIGIASRYVRGSRIVNSPFHRKLLSRTANGFNSMLFGLPIHDNTNGYRAYPREAIQKLLKYKYKSTGFVTISESSYYLYKKGYNLKEMKTTFVNRRLGGSKADLHEVYVSMRDLLKIRFNL